MMAIRQPYFCVHSRYVRNQIVLANTRFRCVCYHPEEYQIITSGTDRKVSGHTPHCALLAA